MDLIAKTKEAEENFDKGILEGNNTKQHHCQDVANTHGEFIRQHDNLKTEIMDLKFERDSLKGMPRKWLGWVGGGLSGVWVVWIFPPPEPPELHPFRDHAAKRLVKMITF